MEGPSACEPGPLTRAFPSLSLPPHSYPVLVASVFFFSFFMTPMRLKFRNLPVSFLFPLCPHPPRALSLSGSTTSSDGTTMLSSQAEPQSHIRARGAGKCGPRLRMCRLVIGMKASISAMVRTVLLYHLYCHSACVHPSLGYQLLEVSAVTCSSLLFQHHFLPVFCAHTQFTATVLAKTLDLSEYHFAQQICGYIRVKNWVS